VGIFEKDKRKIEIKVTQSVLILLIYSIYLSKKFKNPNSYVEIGLT